MRIKIALAGNPNCGKTTMFNDLTGSTQYVGNWPGVTVEKKEDILPQQPLPENKKLTINDFELLKTIGQGSFGKVFQVVFSLFP